MSYGLTCIKIFRAVDAGVTDTSALYAMVDASLVAEALVGLTAAQQTIVNSYIYVPLASDYSDRGFSVWAGLSPQPVYFKVTGTAGQQDTKMQSALAKRWRA